MDKTLELGQRSIGRLLAKYSIPAVLAMLVNAVYNVVDRIFIANFVGEEALAALTVAFPVMMILFAFAGLIGIGGVALLSIRLGEQDKGGASHVFGNTLGLGLITTTFIVTILLVFLGPILGLFGATADTLVFGQDYLRIILFGFIFQMVSFTLNNSVRTEGRPMLAMVAMMLSAVTNIILDYIFIVPLGWGVQGAALATILGQFTGLAMLLTFYLRHNSVLSMKPRDFIPELQLTLKILSIGFASFISTIGVSLSMVFLNRALVEFGGTAAITSMGAINSLFTLFIMPIMGMQQGMQPIVGYNHGARQPNRVYHTLKLALIASIVFASVVFILIQVFPEFFISMFLDPSSATMATAVRGLRIFMLMLPLISINFIGIAFFQSIARGRMSMVLGILRQLAFLIPAVLILPQFFGLTGVWLATPVADALAIIVSSIALYTYYRKDTRIKESTPVSSQKILEV